MIFRKVVLSKIVNLNEPRAFIKEDEVGSIHGHMVPWSRPTYVSKGYGNHNGS